MGRKAHADYVQVALEVLQELDGGPVSTKTLVATAQEKGLIEEGKWVYHNLSRKVRESDLFDTSHRGLISLTVEVEAEEEPAEEELSTQITGAERTEAQQGNFPEPTLGKEVSN